MTHFEALPEAAAYNFSYHFDVIVTIRIPIFWSRISWIQTDGSGFTIREA
jgi:hypothetical protein